MLSLRIFSISFICGLILSIGSVPFSIKSIPATYAQTIAELEQRIAERNKDIAALEKEIAQYQNQLVKTSAEANTLKELIATLDTTRKKLDADIALTQNKISATTLTIEQLGKEITTKEHSISLNKKTIQTLLRSINSIDQTSLITSVLGSNDVVTIWDDVSRITTVQEELQEQIKTLEDLKTDLQIKKATNEGKKNDLAEQKNTLADQKKVVEYNKQEKDKALSETREQEAEYQRILSQKKALRDAFQQELNEYESQLRIAVDPNSYPSSNSNVLRWPLDKVIITQYFGNTAFATANAAIYGGKGHNAIDLGTPIGTPIKSALSGTIWGTGDTDTACPNASYGKWILVKHNNGLSTLYAHLSVISVTPGQQVSTSQVIGYSGNTGYSTGPHLHFGVYATQGVELVNRPSAACGGRVYYMPVADYKAYLNPLSYLPAI